MSRHTHLAACLSIAFLALTSSALADNHGAAGQRFDPDLGRGSCSGAGGEDTEGAAASSYSDIANSPGMGDGTGCRMVVGSSRSKSRGVVLGVVALGLLAWSRRRRA